MGAFGSFPRASEWPVGDMLGASWALARGLESISGGEDFWDPSSSPLWAALGALLEAVAALLGSPGAVLVRCPPSQHSDADNHSGASVGTNASSYDISDVSTNTSTQDNENTHKEMQIYREDGRW